jgi:hypothetical protein
VPGGAHIGSPSDPDSTTATLHKSQSQVNTQLLQAEILLIINTWRELCGDYHLLNLHPSMLDLAADIIRLYDLMLIIPKAEVSSPEWTAGG